MFGFAVAGLLLGHSLSYLVAFRDPHHRELILQRTGHGYLPAAADVALILMVAAVVALVARVWSGPGGGEPGSVGSLVGLLALVQVGAFAGQEVLERLVAGAPLDDLVRDHLLAIGIVVQVAVAFVGAALLRWTARTVARLAGVVGVLRSRPRPVPAWGLPEPADLPRERVVATRRAVRAPPLS